jgi:hypothetical protein
MFLLEARRASRDRRLRIRPVRHLARLFRYGTRHRRQALPRWPQNFLPEGWQRGRKPRHELPRRGGVFLSTQEHEAVATVGVAAPLFSLSYKGAGNPSTTKAGVAGISFPRGTRNLSQLADILSVMPPAPKRKSTKLRSGRASILRSRAEAVAVAQFDLSEAQRKRLALRERDVW